MKRSKGLFLVVSLLVVALVLLLPGVALADDDGAGRFSVFNGVTIRADETVDGDVGSIFGGVTILGHVNGDVFSMFGGINASGQAQVTGDVIAIFGGVSLDGNAAVDGDVATIFSTINTSPTAKIGGARTEGSSEWEGVQWPPGTDPGDWNWSQGRRSWGANIGGGVFSALLLAGLVVLTFALFPRRVEVVKDTIVRNPWSSLGVGFLALILALPLALLLLITCIGPVVVFLAAFLGIVLGLTGVSQWIGQRTMSAANNGSATPLMTVLAGGLILGLALAALGFVPIINCCSFPIQFLLWSLGIGAVLLSRAGSVPPAESAAAVVPSRPVPPAPMAPVVYPSAPAEYEAPVVYPSAPVEPEPPVIYPAEAVPDVPSAPPAAPEVVIELPPAAEGEAGPATPSQPS